MLGAAVIAACGAPAHPVTQPGRPSYYVSLGDSLAQGVQPDLAGRSVDTRYGYPDQLASTLRRRDPGLQLVKLGCPGETTTTMIDGRHCPYAAGSQLAAAVRFLRAHQGQVELITIDIGANDPNSCFRSASVGRIPPCVAGPVPATAANLAKIMTALRSAAGSRVTIIGMTYYSPELAEWRDGPAGRRYARLSERAALAFNRTLVRVYTSSGARIAEVASAYGSTDFAHPARVTGLGLLPRNVAAVCAWSWICAAPPRGPNEHPNTAGYAVIAHAFLAAAGPNPSFYVDSWWVNGLRACPSAVSYRAALCGDQGSAHTAACGWRGPRPHRVLWH
jgi:lysophospholipase L1-like esterase